MAKMTLSGLASFATAYVAAAKQAGAWSATTDNLYDLIDKIGMQITVSKDSNALKKLNSGELTVWAAAWTSTIDPDMNNIGLSNK